MSVPASPNIIDHCLQAVATSGTYSSAPAQALANTLCAACLMELHFCSIYNERQLLNQHILAAMTSNAAYIGMKDTLWPKQEYVTPHSRANIVHPERHQQASMQPMAQPAPVKVKEEDVDVRQQPVEDLPVLIQRLEDNLEKELRHISEQDYVTVMKLLKPLQV